jgi:flagellin
MLISNNQDSFKVWSNYTTATSAVNKNMTDLAKATKNPVDDPANIAIAARMLAEMSSSAVARQNTDTAISMLQTADGWEQSISDQLSDMKSLAVRANSGILSAADMKNIEVQFESLQDGITQITSNYDALGKFNGIDLFQGNDVNVQVGTGDGEIQELDLPDLTVTSQQIIGQVDTYEYDSNNQLVGSTHTDVQWGEIIDSKNGISIYDSDVIGKIDSAIDYLSNQRAYNASEESRMMQTRDALLTQEANLMDAQSKIMDLDMALGSTALASSLVQSQTSLAMLAQADQLSG